MSAQSDPYAPGLVHPTGAKESNPTLTPAEAVKVLAETGVATPLVATTGTKFKRLWVYPGKAVSGGEITPNTNDVYVGMVATNQPDKRGTSDTDYPVQYDAPEGATMDLSTVYIRGTTGDGVVYRYV